MFMFSFCQALEEIQMWHAIYLKVLSLLLKLLNNSLSINENFSNIQIKFMIVKNNSKSSLI